MKIHRMIKDQHIFSIGNLNPTALVMRLVLEDSFLVVTSLAECDIERILKMYNEETYNIIQCNRCINEDALNAHVF